MRATDHHPVLASLDVSLGTPDEQFQALSNMLQADDAARPAPFTGTPPWGEPTHISEYVSDSVLQGEYIIPPDVDAQANVELLSVISDAYPANIPEWDWENDDQYYGLGVPPGVPNLGQPLETGHSQIIRNNPAAEHGWDAWSGRAPMARVARMENHFSGYSAGTSRGHMLPVEQMQNRRSAVYRTQQARDLLLATIQKRGIHNVVVVPPVTQSYTDQVLAVDPSVLVPEMAIGPEGVVP